MLHYLPGIILVQLVTIALYRAVLAARLDNTQNLMTIGLLEVLLGTLAAFWFYYIGRRRHWEELEALKEDHARERESIKVKAEQQKSRIVKRSQKQILRETRKAHARANLKIGAAFAGALAFGGIMLYSQFVTFGLLVLTTAGGGLAGYLVRGRQLALARKREFAARQRLKLEKKPADTHRLE